MRTIHVSLFSSGIEFLPVAILSLVWEPNAAGDNVTNYKVYYGNAPGAYGTPIAVGTAPAYQFHIGSLPSPVYLALTAENAQGESDFSDEISV